MLKIRDFAWPTDIELVFDEPDFDEEEEVDFIDDIDFTDDDEELWPDEQIAVSANSDGSIVVDLGVQQLYLESQELAEELIGKLSWAADSVSHIDDRTPF